MSHPPSTLIIGIGNPTRRDDAAGIVLAEELETLALPDVEVQTAQQLNLEMTADWATRRRVLVLDAAVSGDPVSLTRLEDTPDPATAAQTHSAHPAPLAALAEQLYGHRPEVWLCSLRAESFDFGTELTPSMHKRLRAAQGKILAWIRSEAAEKGRE